MLNIRLFRVSKSMTLYDVAAATGKSGQRISVSRLSLIEREQVEASEVERVRIARALQAPVDRLFQPMGLNLSVK